MTPLTRRSPLRCAGIAGVSAFALVFAVASAPGPAAAAPSAAATPAAAKPDAPKDVAQSAQVADIQRYLNRLGYEAGPVDGLMGSRTRTAIRAYQQDRGLLATGQPSAALRDNLRAQVVERFGSADAPTEDRDTDTGAPTSLVSGIQRDLGRLGYAVPTTSGTLTAETRAAIRAYQRDSGLLVTGEPSAALRDHIADSLGERAGTDAEAGDSLDADAIATIQSELRRRGYGIAAVSGQVDAGTRAAIRAYQRDTGQTVTGQPSRALLDRLTRAESDTPAGPTTDQIAGVQRALNQRGYEAGPVDGVLGPGTRTAIRTYQSDSGLEPTGRVSADLLARLGVTGDGEADDGTTDDGSGDDAAETGADDAPDWRTVIADGFDDGDYTSGPAWQIAAGQFSIRNGGMTSTITRRQVEGLEDVGRELLGNVLQEQLGVTLPGQETYAAAYLPIPLGNVFRMEAVVSGSGDASARLNLGPYQGGNIGQGYRLDYRAGQGRPLALRLAGQSGAPTVAAGDAALADGNRHTIRFARDANGRMLVSVDGRVAIETTDQVIGGGFDGLSLINGGGTWTLHSIRVDTPD